MNHGQTLDNRRCRTIIPERRQTKGKSYLNQTFYQNENSRPTQGGGILTKPINLPDFKKVKEARIWREERARESFKESAWGFAWCLDTLCACTGWISTRMGNDNFWGKSNYWSCNVNNSQSTHRTRYHSYSLQPEWKELTEYTKNQLYLYILAVHN